MKKIILFSSLLLVSVWGKKDVAPLTGDAFVRQHLALLQQIGTCTSAARDKFWCRVVDFAGAAKSVAPETGVYLGVTTFVQTNGGSPATLQKFSRVSSLAIRKSGNAISGLVATINPNNETGKAEVARLLPLVRGQIDGAAKPEVKEPGLSAYLKSLPDRAKYPLVAHAKGWTLDGGSKADLRRIGNAWVSVEVPQKNPAGIWVTIFAPQ